MSRLTAFDSERLKFASCPPNCLEVSLIRASRAAAVSVNPIVEVSRSDRRIVKSERESDFSQVFKVFTLNQAIKLLWLCSIDALSPSAGLDGESMSQGP